MASASKTRGQLLDELEKLQARCYYLEQLSHPPVGPSSSPFDHLPAAYQSLDSDGRFLDVNSRWLEMLGYDREEVIGRWFGDFIVEAERDALPERFERFKAAGHINDVDVRLLRKDGEAVRVRIDGTIARDEDGGFLRTHCILRDVTDRVRAEEAMRESEERYRNLFESANDAILLIKDGAFTECNGVTLELLGRTAEEVIGHRPDEFAPPTQPDGQASMEKAGETLVRALAGEPQFIEWVYTRKDGTEAYAELSMSAVEFGGHSQIQVIARDITERKLVEEALRENEAILNETGRIAQIGGWRHDLVTGEAVWTKGLYDIVEMESGPPPGPGEHLDYYPPEDRAILAEAYQRAVDTGEPFDLELHFLTARGNLRWARIIGRPSFDGGKCIAMAGTAQDITDRKLAEAALRESEEFNSSIIRSSSDCIKVLDLEGHIQYMSPGGTRAMELDDAEACLHSSWISLWEGTDNEAAREAVSRARQGETSTFQGYCPTAKGTPKWWDIVVSPIVGADGSIKRLLCISRDVTERMKAEEAMNSLARFPSENPYPVLRIAGDGTVLHANRAAEALIPEPDADGTRPAPADWAATAQQALTSGRVGYLEGEAGGKTFALRFVPITGEHYVNVYGADVTERVRAEEAVRKQQQQLAQYLDVAGVILTVLNRSGEVTLINKRGCQILGCSQEDVLGAHWIDRFIPEHSRGDVGAVLERLLAGEIEHAEYFENPVLTTDGQERVISWHNALLRDESGAIVGALSSGEDVTERVKAEQALRESEERFRIAAQSASDLIYEWDIESNRLDWYGDIDGALGYEQGQLPRTLQAWVEHIHPDDKQRLAEAVEHQKTTGERFNLEYRMVAADGAVRHWTDRAEVLFDEGGEPVRQIGVCTDVTDTRDAQEAVRESERRLRAILNSSTQSVFLLDNELRLLEANEILAERLGAGLDEMMGRDVLQFVPPDVAETRRPIMLEAIRTGRAEVFSDQRQGVWIESSIYPVFDDAGAVGGLAVYASDVSERMRGEEALRESEQRYRDLFGHAGDAIYILDLEGAILDANEEATRQLGYSHQELLRLTPADLDVHDHIGQVRERMETIRTQGRIVFETGHRRKDGSVIPIEVSARAVELHGHTRALIICRDITDRKQAAAALQRRLAYEKMLADISAKAVIAEDAHRFQDVALDIMGEALDVSRIYIFEHRRQTDAMDNTVEWTAPDVVPQMWNLQGIPANSLPWWVETLRAGDIISYEDIEDIPSDDEREILHAQDIKSILVVPLFVRGEYYGFMGFDECREHRPWEDEDVDILRTAAAVLMSRLEQEWAKEEKAQLEAQLLQTQKMEAVGRLAGGIAHDFNNVLTGVMGYADLLKLKSKPGDEVFEAASVIAKAAERAAELTDQLLGFARGGKYQNVPVDVQGLIQEALQLLARTLGKDISINQHLHAPGTAVLGDPSQVEQVILNLAVNARDAMPNGGELTVATDVVELNEESAPQHPGAKVGTYIAVSVSDTGCGMPANVLPRIFEPFFTTKEKPEGTGMGLAMVYGIVRNHGGFVEAESELGVGSTFRVWLPISTRSGETYGARKTDRPVRGSGLVMLVDDEELVRDTATRILTSLGYEVLGTPGGEEAVAAYRRSGGEIDVVILDMVMPDLDGRSTLRALKEIDPDVRVILSTGYGLDTEAQQIMDEGACGFVQKPYEVARLSQVVARALGIHQE